MAGGCVADFVDTLHDGVQRCVIAYGGIGAIKVVVDCTGQTDDWKIEFVGKYTGTGKRAVAAYHHQSVDAVTHQYVVGQLTAFGSGEFFTTGGLEYCAALLYDIGHILGAEVNNFVCDKTTVTAVYAFYLKTSENSGAGNGADSGVHTGCVAAGGKYTYTFYFCHG